MKKNQIRELVNELRDIAIEYHGTQQLRERIARTVRAAWHHDLEKPNQPVSQTYELPQTQLEQVADLYEMQFDDGRTCAFHTDGAKAAQWLLACDGNKVQEYVRIERYQEAVIGNSPVIPDGYALVPVEPTDEMIAAAMNCEDVLFNSDESFYVQFGNIYEAMLAAAPQPEQR
ncbi:eaa protein [Salmonella enterica subsp. enterica serovar Gaminara]|uniref:Eaa protein n=1 Tax=Salmonella enterica subsp. enterica serovar Gaminara TaxID=913070 RepID=A0A7Z1QKS4_SALET|nr:eaa protein [Salmonella enterica]EEH1591907.1 eaa protein [Salmonella enterica]PVM62420.1 eaa protein [Salmonella enterica subsp. enterica serovar Gaminara]